MLQCQRKHSVCDSNHSEEENVHQAAPLSQTCGWDFVDTSPALARHFTFGCLEHLTSAVLYFTRRWKMYLRNRDSYKNNVYISEEKKKKPPTRNGTCNYTCNIQKYIFIVPNQLKQMVSGNK